MKPETEITETLERMKQKYEQDEGKRALSSASIIMALEWVLEVEDKFIDLARPQKLLKPNQFEGT